MAFLQTQAALPQYGMQISALNYSKVTMLGGEYELLARWNTKCGLESWTAEPGAIVEEALPASLNTRGVWGLSAPLWLVVLRDDWLGPDADPRRPTSFLVRDFVPAAAKLKAERAYEHGFSSEGVVPLTAPAYHHLMSQRFFEERMPEGMRDQLEHRPERGFHVAHLTRSRRLGYSAGLHSFVFPSLSLDPRAKLLPTYFTSPPQPPSLPRAPALSRAPALPQSSAAQGPGEKVRPDTPAPQLPPSSAPPHPPLSPFSPSELEEMEQEFNRIWEWMGRAEAEGAGAATMEWGERWNEDESSTPTPTDETLLDNASAAPTAGLAPASAEESPLPPVYPPLLSEFPPLTSA